MRRLLDHIDHLAHRHGPRGPCALVFAAPGVTYGMARMLAQLAQTSKGPVEAFTDMEQARAWLVDHAPGQATAG